MSLADLMHEDRRLCILQCLAEAEGRALNEDLLVKLVGHFRLGVVAPDMLRGYLSWLEAHDLVRIEKLTPSSGELWIATLTATGLSVTQGRKWPGVALPSPR